MAVYKLQNLTNEELEDYHVEMLKAFEYDAEYTDPSDIAHKEEELRRVERIVNHRVDGENDYLRNYSFLVKWEGKDEGFNEWLSWKKLRTNTQYYDYMRNSLGSLLVKPLFRI